MMRVVHLRRLTGAATLCNLANNPLSRAVITTLRPENATCKACLSRLENGGASTGRGGPEAPKPALAMA